MDERHPGRGGRMAVTPERIWDVCGPLGLALLHIGNGGNNGAAAALGSKASRAVGLPSPDLSPGVCPVHTCPEP